MSISFQEKSIWISLVITILLFGLYFVMAFIVFTNPYDPNTNLVGLFIGVIILYVIFQIVLHSLVAIVHKKEADKSLDERDNLIELKATRISYFILVLGVWVTGTSMLPGSSLMMAHIIMFFFVLAEIVGFLIQLFYYRRGV